MSIVSDQATLTTSAKVVYTAPPAIRGATVTIQLLTASATVYIGGSGVTTSNGFKLQNGTAPSAGVIAPLAGVTLYNVTGDILAIGAAGGEVLSLVATWADA